MPAPAIREMLHLVRAYVHVCMRVLAERVACIAHVKALYSVPRRTCKRPHSRPSKCQVLQDMCSASPSAVHLQTTRTRDVMRSSPDTSVGLPLAVGGISSRTVDISYAVRRS
jgi:hypothetical protein